MINDPYDFEQHIRKYDDESFTKLAVWLVRYHPDVARDWLKYKAKLDREENRR